MVSTASMALLQGEKKDSSKEDEAKPVEESASSESQEEIVQVEISDMTKEQLEDLVLENDLEVPDGWDKMDLDGMREFLEKEYGEASDGTEAPPEEEKDVAKEKTEAKTDTKTETKSENKTEEKGKTAEKDKSQSKESSGTGKDVSTDVLKVHEGVIEVPGKDMISDVSHEIENLTKEDARGLVAQLHESTEFNFFKLGGVLSVIQSNGWYDPYGTFKEYVETEHGVNYRKAMYLVSIYNGLVEAGVPWDKVKAIGWTKLKEIAPVLDGKNTDKWVKIAKNQTTLQLVETVKSAQQVDSGASSEGTESKTVTTKSFKIHEDQLEIVNAAIEKAKEEGHTDVDTVALTYACQAYLSGAVSQAGEPPEKATPDNLKEVISGMEPEAILEMVAEANPSINITVSPAGEDD